jgi:hypothetical protein
MGSASSALYQNRKQRDIIEHCSRRAIHRETRRVQVGQDGVSQLPAAKGRHLKHRIPLANAARNLCLRPTNFIETSTLWIADSLSLLPLRTLGLGPGRIAWNANGPRLAQPHPCLDCFAAFVTLRGGDCQQWSNESILSRLRRDAHYHCTPKMTASYLLC